MPARFEDYEIELLRVQDKRNQPQHGYRKSSDSSYQKATATSAPTSTSTTRSSFSSSRGYVAAQATPTVPPHRETLSRLSDNTNPFLHPTKSSHTAGTDIRRNHSGHSTVVPTASIQVWAHQVHIQQRTRYDWCSECYPKIEPLEVPTERAMRRVRIQEPTHCYE